MTVPSLPPRLLTLIQLLVQFCQCRQQNLVGFAGQGPRGEGLLFLHPVRDVEGRGCGASHQPPTPFAQGSFRADSSPSTALTPLSGSPLE